MTSRARALRSISFAALDITQAGTWLGTRGPRLLLYHGVTKESGSGIFNYRQKFVPTDAFRAQIAWMKKRYDILPLAEFVERRAAGALPANALALTFDDGYANNYTDAFPVLHELKVPATFFITTGFIEGAPLPVDRVEYALGHTRHKTISLPWDAGERVFPLINQKERIRADLVIRSFMKTLSDPHKFLETLEERTGVKLQNILATSPYRPLSWEEMRTMEEGGMTFAPHTRTHAILSRLDTTQATEEIFSSKKSLEEHLARPLSTIFAYPNGARGDYTEETISLLRNAGFAAALTTEPRTISADHDAFRLPRYTMDGATDLHRARLQASGAYTRLARFL